MKIFIITIIFSILFFVEAAKYKSFSDFLQHQKPSLKIAGKIIISSATTKTLTINNNEIFGDTLFEKLIVVAVSSFITAITGYVCVCLYKCVRNDCHFKKSWFLPKRKEHHHQFVTKEADNKVMELVAFETPSIELV